MTAEEDAALQHNARLETRIEQGFYMPMLAIGGSAHKEVALTFDDGPHPFWTPALLDLLKSLNVRATFFVVGKMVDRYPDLARRQLADGNELANHTYDHSHLMKLSEAQVATELSEGADAIRRATGFSPRFYRPPGGRLNEGTLRAAAGLHTTAVMWTVNSKDFTRPPASVIEQRLLAGVRPGAILLCHDGIPQTLQMLPDLVSRLRAQGYTFVTVSELARHMNREAREQNSRLHA